jgi:glutathione S-transferase
MLSCRCSQGEHKQPPFLEVNPFGKLPAVKCDDGTPVFESGAILLYIAEKYGGLSSAEERATAAQWIFWANATFSPAMFNTQQRAQQMPQLCGALDAVLSKHKFLLGNAFTVADVAVGAYLAYTCMFFPDITFNEWPAIQAYLEGIQKRPAFAATIGSE